MRRRWRRRKRCTRNTRRRRIKTRGGKMSGDFHGKMEDNLRKREILLSFQ